MPISKALTAKSVERTVFVNIPQGSLGTRKWRCSDTVVTDATGHHAPIVKQELKSDLSPVWKLRFYTQSASYSDTNSVVADVPKQQQPFYKWTLNKIKQRSNRCKHHHSKDLKQLNAHITRCEIRRAIKSFDDDEAYGPDNSIWS